MSIAVLLDRLPNLIRDTLGSISDALANSPHSTVFVAPSILTPLQAPERQQYSLRNSTLVGLQRNNKNISPKIIQCSRASSSPVTNVLNFNLTDEKLNALLDELLPENAVTRKSVRTLEVKLTRESSKLTLDDLLEYKNRYFPKATQEETSLGVLKLGDLFGRSIGTANIANDTHIDSFLVYRKLCQLIKQKETRYKVAAVAPYAKLIKNLEALKSPDGIATKVSTQDGFTKDIKFILDRWEIPLEALKALTPKIGARMLEQRNPRNDTATMLTHAVTAELNVLVSEKITFHFKNRDILLGERTAEDRRRHLKQEDGKGYLAATKGLEKLLDQKQLGEINDIFLAHFIHTICRDSARTASEIEQAYKTAKKLYPENRCNDSLGMANSIKEFFRSLTRTKVFNSKFFSALAEAINQERVHHDRPNRINTPTRFFKMARINREDASSAARSFLTAELDAVSSALRDSRFAESIVRRPIPPHKLRWGAFEEHVLGRQLTSISSERKPLHSKDDTIVTLTA